MFFVLSTSNSDEMSDHALRSKQYRESLRSDPDKLERYKKAARERFHFLPIVIRILQFQDTDGPKRRYHLTLGEENKRT